MTHNIEGNAAPKCELIADFEEKCPACSGTSLVKVRDVTGQVVDHWCLKCSGRGVVPSAQGHALLKFLDRWKKYDFQWKDELSKQQLERSAE